MDALHIHFVFEQCPAYKQIRIKYGSRLFSCLGVIKQSAMIRVLTREPEQVPEFLSGRLPRLLACFAECLNLHWQTDDDLVPYGGMQDTFRCI